MADYRSDLLTSTQPMAQQAAMPARGYSTGYSHHQNQHQHQSLHKDQQHHRDRQNQESALHYSDTAHLPSQDLVTSQPTQPTIGGFARTPSKSDSSVSSSSSPPSSSSSSSPQQSLITQHRFRPKARNAAQLQEGMPPSPGLNLCTPSPGEDQKGEQSVRSPDEQKFVVRLDLRKLSKKSSSRGHSSPQLKVVPAAVATPSRGSQTKLSASSWSVTKSAPGPPVASNSTPEATLPSPLHMPNACAADTILAPERTIDGHVAAENPPLKGHSPPPETDRKATHEERDGPRTEDDDEDYIGNGSQAMKRQGSSRVLREPASKKRTRTPDQGHVKKKKVDERKKLDEEVSSRRSEVALPKKESSKKSVKCSVVHKDTVAISGDELALKYNNDFCEACAGLGEFICCDTCPKAFHFACCEPPVDSLNLPDEWHCNECRAAKNPPLPARPGIFKQLMDNVNRSNPKAFVLPAEIRSFFKGVIANSDGEYEDAAEHKPKSKRISSSMVATGFMSQAEEDALKLQDVHGDIRLCYSCNKSAVGGRWMISCDHCPLHWHLDCLSPPMASPPPITRKWMCPNHAEHVSPRRRKRRDAIAVQLDDPKAPNDGNIEVIPDPDTAAGKRSIWDTDTSGFLYRVPERSIKQSFIEKCQRVRESVAQARLSHPVLSEAHSTGAASAQRFDFLVAAALANKHIADSMGLSDVSSQDQGRILDLNRDKAEGKPGHEAVQNTVLEKLTDPAERQEYLRFRAFQRYVREHGTEEAMRQWMDRHEHEKERIASEELLNL